MNYNRMTLSKMFSLSHKIMNNWQRKDFIKFLNEYGVDAGEIKEVKVKPKKLPEKKEPQLVIIDDSGIIERRSNGGRKQDIIFRYKGVDFKIVILSESYSFQSYAKLYSSVEKKIWTLVKSGNPADDFNISIAYSDSYTSDVFEPIIKAYKEVAKKLMDVE